MEEIKIDNQNDIDNHFKFHKKLREDAYEKRSKFLDSCHDKMTKNEIEEYLKLGNEIDKLDFFSYKFELQDNKIIMYVNHEGSALENIQYCPFCGIKFNITEYRESENK